MHEVRTFAPCKAFLFDMFAFFSSLENYFGFRTTNVKGKTDDSVMMMMVMIPDTHGFIRYDEAFQGG